MPYTYSPTIKARMQRLFDTCVIAEDKYSDIDRDIRQIAKAKTRYQAVSLPFNVPWYVTGIIHKTICGCDFKTHMFNGDPLNGRTMHVPVGYPKKGRPPFTWEQSTEDMFLFYHWESWSDWSVPGILYNLEAVSRFEYTSEDAESSRLWGFSNHFVLKEREDTQQCGSATLLRRMVEKQVIKLDVDYNQRLQVLKELGSEIMYMPNRSSQRAFELQRLMNVSGACIREDGRIGKFSADAYYRLTREYLNGDPEAQP